MRRHKFYFSILNMRYNKSNLLLFVRSLQLALGRCLMFPRFDCESHKPFIIVLFVKLFLLIIILKSIDSLLATPRSNIILIGLAQCLLMLVPRAIGLQQGRLPVNQSTGHLS